MYNPKAKKSMLGMVEKASYAVIIPAIFGYCGWRMYNHNIVEFDKRAIELKKVEDKCCDQAQENLIRNQNRKQSAGTNINAYSS
jgi:hypothetical protein